MLFQVRRKQNDEVGKHRGGMGGSFPVFPLSDSGGGINDDAPRTSDDDAQKWNESLAAVMD